MEKTIAAIATGNSVGGIGVIRISGNDAIAIADKVFKSADGSLLSSLKGYRAKFGNIYINGSAMDNAVALVFRAPKSYTGEDVCELSVHGGIFIVEKTLEAVLSAGAEPAGAGEFTKRAFLNGKIDLTQAESVADLISAQGETAMQASFNALQGALSKKINKVLDVLLDASANLSAWVDYPDEEIPELDDNELKKSLKDAYESLKSLVDNYDNGKSMLSGIDTAIVGRANAGKSSLMNLLSGKNKSIVTEIEGTTRDVVEETVRLGSLVLHLKDTAGLRKSDDIVEGIGIKRAYEAMENAQLVLPVFDINAPLNDDDIDIINRCKGKCAVAVINKNDLAQKTDVDFIEKSFEKCIFISAKNDESTEKLENAVKEVIGVAQFDASLPMLANQRQKQCCNNAMLDVFEAIDCLDNGITRDAINVLVDSAVDELLSLTGQKATTQVVNNIFSKFCVGK